MNKTGVVKQIDGLGRIVIPKDIRDRFQLNDSVEIIPTEEGIVLRKPCKIIFEVNEEN